MGNLRAQTPVWDERRCEHGKSNQPLRLGGGTEGDRYDPRLSFKFKPVKGGEPPLSFCRCAGLKLENELLEAHFEKEYSSEYAQTAHTGTATGVS